MSTICNTSVDYSNDSSGGRILPFKITLTADSILSPSAGERQKFCYDIEATGSDTSAFADLSHFLLGICPDITQDDFHSVTVSINEIPQTVIWGGNIEIRTADHPDPPTHCTGLKFNFPLDKETGNIMHVCFELNETAPIGPNNVCLFGGNTTKTGMAVCGPACSSTQGCTQTVFQQATVCVPVTVKPFAIPGEAVTICCDDPVVTNGTSFCTPSGRTECTFTVKQTLCIEIPIIFGADVITGNVSTTCDGASTNECECLMNETADLAKDITSFGNHSCK